MGFFSGKSLLRVEYVIWIHDIHRICPLKLDLLSVPKSGPGFFANAKFENCVFFTFYVMF